MNNLFSLIGTLVNGLSTSKVLNLFDKHILCGIVRLMITDKSKCIPEIFNTYITISCYKK